MPQARCLNTAAWPPCPCAHTIPSPLPSEGPPTPVTIPCLQPLSPPRHQMPENLINRGTWGAKRQVHPFGSYHLPRSGFPKASFPPSPDCVVPAAWSLKIRDLAFLRLCTHSQEASPLCVLNACLSSCPSTDSLAAALVLTPLFTPSGVQRRPPALCTGRRTGEGPPGHKPGCPDHNLCLA